MEAPAIIAGNCPTRRVSGLTSVFLLLVLVGFIAPRSAQAQSQTEAGTQTSQSNPDTVPVPPPPPPDIDVPDYAYNAETADAFVNICTSYEDCLGFPGCDSGGWGFNGCWQFYEGEPPACPYGPNVPNIYIFLAATYVGVTFTYGALRSSAPFGNNIKCSYNTACSNGVVASCAPVSYTVTVYGGNSCSAYDVSSWLSVTIAGVRRCWIGVSLPATGPGPCS